MRFAKILSVATLPMFLFACSDSNSGNFGNNPGPENPQEQPKDSIPENIPDEDLKPITRDYSLIWSGKGTAEDPFLITSEQDLASLAFYVNDSSMTFKDNFFKLTADIALTKPWSPIGIFGKNAYGLGNRVFSGTFDGSLKTISGLTVNDTASYSGLFGLARGAHISNVVIKDAKMNVGSVAGVLAGLADSVTVENCTIENAEIKGTDRVGGLVGEAKYVTVTNASVSGSVSGTNNVGGVLGSVQNGALTGLTNGATVAGKSVVGGVVGGSSSVGEESSISMALNLGAVAGTKDVGGVVGTLSSTKLEKAGNYGAVTADESQLSNVGGVIAVASNKSSVNEAFNTGTVTVKKVMVAGGVIGSLKAVAATNLFNQGEISGQASNLGGLVGVVDNDAKLESGYNSGKIPDNNLSGTVAGKVTSTATVTNVYYDKTVGGTCLVVANQMSAELPTGFTTEEMKAATFVATLNGTGAVWAIDPAKFGGYPSFSWAK
ncbi:hypothetical protein [Fibrobacter sp. UWB12]|uniref:hypothetical protein n=2 Tax=unclassified Fibrobacter TaxID=2634177 RepID=UPI000911B4FC|nr:hypothetical protein [Fibrobacter sp. UWB12]SHK92906.1 hypothetical protein SAMN05720759_10944 [Fibrobacter sp. UWB12]SIO07401.1 hypothetical protein SAMN05720758_1285 [Fibrobacter sp. UWB11]